MCSMLPNTTSIFGTIFDLVNVVLMENLAPIERLSMWQTTHAKRSRTAECQLKLNNSLYPQSFEIRFIYPIFVKHEHHAWVCSSVVVFWKTFVSNMMEQYIYQQWRGNVEYLLRIFCFVLCGPRRPCQSFYLVAFDMFVSQWFPIRSKVWNVRKV